MVPPGTAGTSAGADAARTRRSAWTALVLLVGGLSLGVVLALVGGPWQVLAVLHLGALAIWFLVWRRSWRDLLRSAGPRSPWLLFAVGSGLCALSAVARHPIDNPGAVLAPVTPTGLLSALAMALGVGVLMNAVPEEFSLRRCLLEPLRAQFGGGFALWTTALAFVVIHLPTWISSHATASNYAAEVPEKLLFGLVAAWSVLRLDSLAFALGMHVGGNFTGVLLDSLSREETLTGWSRFTTPSVIAILAETLVTAAAVWYLGRPNRTSRPRR
ncbi:CAAX amino terminal protease family protein [Actinomyces johnsonii F0510]|uniref:CAAX amino terminal protease family protein n=1 Tax=Actinomyces johnsonii F0510 TaxID=1227262 RepID=U1PYY8_9ACTO|nr:CAAX amino terminal protease family protein [Actinomyces johnsonii F0510]